MRDKTTHEGLRAACRVLRHAGSQASRHIVQFTYGKTDRENYWDAIDCGYIDEKTALFDKNPACWAYGSLDNTALGRLIELIDNFSVIHWGEEDRTT